jgi:hypothetical protein
MKVWLSKPIIGYKSTTVYNTWNTPTKRVHAEAGEVLPVILHNPTHYICDSVNYPGNHIIVFPSQVAEVIYETNPTDNDNTEEYYNLCDEPKSVIELENDLPYSTLQSDDDLMD